MKQEKNTRKEKKNGKSKRDDGQMFFLSLSTVIGFLMISYLPVIGLLIFFEDFSASSLVQSLYSLLLAGS